MVSTWLFLISAVVIIIDVLIGVLRGGGFSLLRMILWTLGTVISALAAKGQAIRIILYIAASEGLEAESLGDLTIGKLAEQMDRYYAEIFGAPVAGLALSVAVPVVFVALFIGFKLVSWLIYLVLKLVIKHLAKKKFGDYKKLRKSRGSMLQMSIFPEQGNDGAAVPAVAEPAAYDGAAVPAVAEPAAYDGTAVPAVAEPAAYDGAPVPASIPTGFLGFFVNKPLWSRIAGGVLGFFTAVFAMAIIASPVTGIMSAINDRNAVESLIHLMDIMEETDFDTLKENALSDDEVRVVSVDGEIEINNREISSAELVKDWDSLNNSFVLRLYSLTGARATADSLYRSLSTVYAEELGVRKASMDSYNFADTVGHIMGVIPRIDSLATALCEGNGVSDRAITAAENLLFYVFGQGDEGELISKKDKKNIVNNAITELNVSIRSALSLGADVELIPLFETYDDILGKMDEVFNMTRKMLVFMQKIDRELGSHPFNADYSDFAEVISEPKTVNDVIDMVIDIDGASQVAAETANAIVSEATGGRYGELIRPEGIEELKGNAERQERVADTVADLAEYALRDPDTISDQESQIIYEELMYLANLDILDAGEAYELWYHYLYEY